MDCSCLELALEGERLCRQGNCEDGVKLFEAALCEGTDDLQTLSAIFSQLGNAYFYLQRYDKAFEYHKHDLTLARSTGDKNGEAKASGNLGNTLKVLGQYDEATVCCQRHLDIARSEADPVNESRALYNLGNIYHTRGKELNKKNGNTDPGNLSPEVSKYLQQAIDYYLANLILVRQLDDRVNEGRVCGMLGNCHYLLGRFEEAIDYHLQRLKIGKEFGDRQGQRRAYVNLANAHIFKQEYDLAIEYYRKALEICMELGDETLEAQSCYSLGTTCTLLGDHETAIQYYTQHLQIANRLNDKVGEQKSSLHLCTSYKALGDDQEAFRHATRHLLLARELRDSASEAANECIMNDLRQSLGDDIERKVTSHLFEKSVNKAKLASAENSLSESMLTIPSPFTTPNKSQSNNSLSQRESSIDSTTPGRNEELQRQRLEHTTNGDVDEDDFFEMLYRFQARRIDEQRCSFKLLPESPDRSLNVNGQNDSASISPRSPAIANLSDDHIGREALLDMIAGFQSKQFHEQRASVPGLTNPMNLQMRMPDDKFFDMLIRCQRYRIDEQRSNMPSGSNNLDAMTKLPDIKPSSTGSTVPEEDFFDVIMAAQGRRMNSQRTLLPTTSNSSVESTSHTFDSRTKALAQSNEKSCSTGVGDPDQPSTSSENRPMSSEGESSSGVLSDVSVELIPNGDMSNNGAAQVNGLNDQNEISEINTTQTNAEHALAKKKSRSQKLFSSLKMKKSKKSKNETK